MSVLGSVVSADVQDAQGPKHDPEGDGSPEWNEALEEILRKEGEQAEALFWMHNQASVLATRYNDIIQIPAIITATVTGFLSATSDLVPPVGIGALSVVVGILGTVNSYYKFSQRAEGHRITSLWYMKTYKQIECQLALPVAQRANAEIFLRSLRDEMSRVSETAPVIPESVILKFKTQFKDGKTSVPIIANGLDRIQVWKKEVKPEEVAPPPAEAPAEEPQVKVEIIPAVPTASQRKTAPIWK